jgi:hypothetical protein
MTRAAALSVAVLLSMTAARADEPTPVSLSTGETVNLCKRGLAMCPVSSFLCDDPKVAVVEHGPEGALLKAVAPGTTLCSVLGPEQAFRRVFRVTVHPRGR